MSLLKFKEVELPYVEKTIKRINKQLIEILQTLNNNRKQAKEYSKRDEQSVEQILSQVKQMRGIIERYILRYTNQKKLTEY